MKQLILRAAVVSLATGAAACDAGETPFSAVPAGAPAFEALSATNGLELDYMTEPGGNTFRIRNNGSAPVSLAYRVVGAAVGTPLIVAARTEVFVAAATADSLEVLQGGVVILSAANGGAPLAAAPLCNGDAATIWPGAAGSSRTVGGTFAAPTWQRWRFAGTRGDDVIVGSVFSDIIRGSDGDDVMCGEGGSDHLYPGTGVNRLYGGDGGDFMGMQNVAGINTFDGGAGFDVLQLGSSAGKTVVDLQAGTVVGGYYDGSTVTGIESLRAMGSMPVEFYGDSARNIFDGGDGADILDGRGGNDVLRGKGGNDSLLGGEGIDNLYGGSGVNALFGGPGDDYMNGEAVAGVHAFDGGDGVDVLVTRSSGGLTTVRLLTGTITGGYYGGSTVVNVENVTNGSLTAPVAYYGDGGDNILRGGNAADQLFGGSGNDRMYGYGGADALQGGNGWDTLMGGGGNDRLDGGNQGDTLYGNSGADVLIGGNGRDRAVNFNAAEGDTATGVETGV